MAEQGFMISNTGLFELVVFSLLILHFLDMLSQT